MRVLVTGAAGFVGRHLVPRLQREGCDVTATDRELDVADAARVEARIAAAAPDAIVHLAALSSVPASRREPDLTYRVNYLGALSILEGAARRSPGARILLVGTSEVYGVLPSGAAPFDEACALRPRSPYARTKAAADLLGAGYAARGLDVVRVRPFNHAGPGQSDAFVLSSFARQIAEIESGRGEATLRVGNLDSVRDFLDIADVIDAYVRLLDASVPARAYNVASGRGQRIGDLLERLVMRSARPPRIEVDPERLRPRDVAIGDATRLRRATGWAPRVPLDASLDALLDWWRRQVRAA